MASSENQVETGYTLLSEDEPALISTGHANGGTPSIHPRTNSTPMPDKAERIVPERRWTNVSTRKASPPVVATSTSPLIGSESANGGEYEDRGEDIVFLEIDPQESDQEETELIAENSEREDEQEDFLGPLSPSPSSKPKGILKRTSALDSETSFSGYVSSSSSIKSPPSSLRRGGWRKESKVSFRRPSSTSFELRDLSVGVSRSASLAESYDDHEELEQVDDRLLSGSRIRSSLTRLARLNIRKKRQKPQPQLERLQSRLDLDDLSRDELELKANLYFHIGNPIKRWKVDRVVPMKLCLQLLKTFCLIVQVILFTDLTISYRRSEFFYNSRVVFESLFIKDFQDGFTEPRDHYVAYNIPDMYAQLEYLSKQYFSLPEISIGGYDYNTLEDGSPTPIHMTLTQYKEVELNTAQNFFVLNGDMDDIPFNVSKGENVTEVYNRNAQDPYFHRFVRLRVELPVKNIRIVDPERAECFQFTITITFENAESTGVISYLLEETHAMVHCNETIKTEKINDITVTLVFLTFLDLMIIVMCLFSISLTISTLRKATKLAKAMRKFYLRELGIKLKWWEVRSLFPLWHLLNTISDLLIITANFYKIFLNYRVNGVIDANPAALMLGIAVLLQAGVILRYVSYFKQLNTLTRTIALALPELMKFMICAGILFLAFVVNGWIILGPYHQKFRSFWDTFESLFSLINGDDIYGTFIGIDIEDNYFAYVYTRIYIYVFLTLFLYFVLNLFTSLVISAHEASQKYDTAYENEVRRFVFSGPLTLRGAALRDVTRTKNYVHPDVILKRMKGPPPNDSQSTSDSLV